MALVLSEKMSGFLSGLSIPENPVQRRAIDHLQTLDFPTTRDEYWKYTRLGKISKNQYSNSPVVSKEINLEKHLVSGNYVVIENGIIREDLSKLTTDFTVQFKGANDLGEDYFAVSDDVFSTMNAGLFNRAIVVDIAAKSDVKAPLQLLFINSGSNIISNNRVIINAEKFSSSTVVLSSVDAESTNCFNNMISQINVEENAHLKVFCIQSEGDSTCQIATTNVSQAKNSTFRIHTFTVSGLLVRNNINIAVNGENCETYMDGAIIAEEKQHVDNHTFVDHKVSNCYSNENYKYVLDGQSTGVFNGRVVVQQDAQVINAYQNNGNILLSDNASINSKPELEIYADDVKCSHGSTTGQLDESALFYLQTRGISKENARKILVSAFIGEIIDTVENEAIKAQIISLLEVKYGWNF